MSEPSWIEGHCAECHYPVICTQPELFTCYDYRYYCSNMECKNHAPGESIADQDDLPEWVNE